MVYIRRKLVDWLYSVCCRGERGRLLEAIDKLKNKNLYLIERRDVDLEKNRQLNELIVSLKERIYFFDQKNIALNIKVNELYKRNVDYAHRINSQKYR